MPEFGPKDLAVVIPTRNRWPILRRTLDALADQTAAGFETIVVLDGTDQQPPDLGEVRVIAKEHGGPGAARNAGTAATDRALVLFLGDDMVPGPLLVERHLDRHNGHPEPEVAVLGHVDLHPSVSRNRLNRWMDWSGSQFDFHHITEPDAGFGRFYSCNVSLKRDFFTDAGGFDEDFVYYYEDLDCGWRLDRKGLRLLYEREAHVQHLHPLRWNDVVGRYRGIARGERLMAAKHAWFDPFFARRIQRATRRRTPSGLWPRVVDRVPRRLRRIRQLAERRADAWYYARLAPQFIDAWEGARDLDELREYLGDRYDEARLADHMAEVQRELISIGDEGVFYRSSEAYLYDLTVFAMSGTKVPYRTDLERLVGPRARLLDWGCGIGSDGLRFAERSHAVSFADFDNPSTRFLRWRVQRRGMTSPVFDIDRDDIPGGFDAAYAFDVIEHVDDPFAFLRELEGRARIVMVNLLEDEPDPLHPHRSLPIAAILDHAARRGLLLYHRYHGRSHLVAYIGSGRPAGIRHVLEEVHHHEARSALEFPQES
ncbi:MAG: glycosyltransferase, partial [Actinomycetota bacterium]